MQVPAIHGLVLPEQEGSGKDLCMKDCSNEPISQLCASNAKTYDNMCAFENAQCEGESSIIIYTEPCVTLPPPAGTYYMLQCKFNYSLHNLTAMVITVLCQCSQPLQETAEEIRQPP